MNWLSGQTTTADADAASVSSVGISSVLLYFFAQEKTKSAAIESVQRSGVQQRVQCEQHQILWCKDKTKTSVVMANVQPYNVSISKRRKKREGPHHCRQQQQQHQQAIIQAGTAICHHCYHCARSAFLDVLFLLAAALDIIGKSKK